MELGNLIKIDDLRVVWRNEAYDFTPWLAEEDNMALLGETLGIEISDVIIESGVGSFSADIIAKESITGKKIVIENQLEYTNHDHLGKIITYASGTDSEIVIWIVKYARDEHKRAVEWLNENMDSIDFFLIELELWRIGDSKLAPRFSILEQPNTWAKEVKKSSKELSDTDNFKLQYWTSFREYSFEDVDFSRTFNKRKPSSDHWYSVGSGSPEFHFSFLLNTRTDVITVECYISDNKELYHHFHSHKSDIESIIGYSLDWRELPERKASRILLEKRVNLRNESEWTEHFDWFKEIGIKFYKAFKSFE